MNDNETRNAIALTRVNYFNLAGLAELYCRLGSATAVMEHRKDLREVLPEASPRLQEAMCNIEQQLKVADAEMEYNLQNGISAFSLADNDYPQRLKNCDDAPLVLFYKGTACLNRARNFGFGVNGDAFERWAANVPLRCVDHHRDNAFQVEALFMGQAGLLDMSAIPARYQAAAVAEGQFERMKKEYAYLAHKFSLQPLDPSLWLFLRLRPQNFPHIRLSQLAMLHHSRRASLANIVACEGFSQLRKALATQVSTYWQTHYVFGGESKSSDKALSVASRDVLILNTVVPVLFAYGRHRHNEALCDRAFALLDELKAEDNHIVRMWKACGMEVKNAGDTQALIQLKNEYCDRKECLRCCIGYEYLKR